MKTAFMIAGVSVKWWQLAAGAWAIVGFLALSELNIWPLFHSGGGHSSSTQMCSA